MSAMTPLELLRLYTLEKITDQQALGHILQNLVLLYAALDTIEKLKQDIERLKAFTGMEPEAKPKKKIKRRDEEETEGEGNTEDLTGF